MPAFSDVGVSKQNDETAYHFEVWSDEYGTLFRKIYSIVFVASWIYGFLEGTSMCEWLPVTQNKIFLPSTKRTYTEVKLRLIAFGSVNTFFFINYLNLKSKCTLKKENRCKIQNAQSCIKKK